MTQSQSLSGGRADVLIRGGRVVDAASSLDGIADVAISEGRIAAIGSLGEVAAERVIDATGKLVTPGLIDLHVHAFGALGFADVDTVGVRAGVTTVCDAGGAGALSFEDFAAQLADATTDIHSWLYIGPGGISVTLVGREQKKDVREILPMLPIEQLLDVVERHRPRIAGVKVPAFGPTGELGPMMLAKGLAMTLGLPLYVHVGDIQEKMPLPLELDAILALLDERDMVTHCYTPTPNALFDGDGQLRRGVREAYERGVQFDVGMGAFNFDFELARRGMELGFVPQTISSDLQQANVTGPTHSLANVMSMFLELGMPIPEIIRRVTANPAERLRIADSVGQLKVGMAGDVSLLDVVDGEFEFHDTRGGRLHGTRKFVPALAIKAGVPVEVDLDAATVDTNWSMFFALMEDELPPVTASFSAEQRALLGAIRDAAAGVEVWEALEIHRAVDPVVAASPLPRGVAGRTLLGAFLDPVFPQAPGFFLGTLDRAFALRRLDQVR